MNGESVLLVAFGSCFFSVVAYATNHFTDTAVSLRTGRYLFHLTVLTVLVTAAIHLYNVLTHQFQFTYVWSYSSRDLSIPLLISTFYAGQEGSFLLWTLFTAIIGVVLLRDSSRNGYEGQVMVIYTLIQPALLLMLLVKDPFVYVWETWPDQVQAGFMPADGRGLNPLLRNYWMVIHPQVLFAGFASMGVPYAYALRLAPARLRKLDQTTSGRCVRS